MYSAGTHNLASQIASQHFYHRLRWAVDDRRLTAPCSTHTTQRSKGLQSLRVGVVLLLTIVRVLCPAGAAGSSEWQALPDDAHVGPP